MADLSQEAGELIATIQQARSIEQLARTARGAHLLACEGTVLARDWLHIATAITERLLDLSADRVSTAGESSPGAARSTS